jgi:uncharacterized YccA/Bax inhibitor family protein
MAAAVKPGPEEPGRHRGTDPWTDLGLTLPIFLIYHLGVVFLPMRNAADPVTGELRTLANHSLALYAGLTLALGAVFVAVLATLGKKQAFQKRKFLFVALEGALYAVIMKLAASYVVGSLRLGPAESGGPLGNAVMALGAGFYEEIAFRVGLFGVGAWVLRKLVGKGAWGVVLSVGWAVCAAAVFSGWHYVGSLGDAWDTRSFVFRGVCGLVLTAIYVFRGFAPGVWTHALYDLWVMG